MFKNIHKEIVYIGSKLEITQIPISSRMDKNFLLFSYSELLYSSKKALTTDAHRSMGFHNYAEHKKADTRVYIMGFHLNGVQEFESFMLVINVRMGLTSGAY